MLQNMFRENKKKYFDISKKPPNNPHLFTGILSPLSLEIHDSCSQQHITELHDNKKSWNINQIAQAYFSSSDEVYSWIKTLLHWTKFVLRK